MATKGRFAPLLRLAASFAQAGDAKPMWDFDSIFTLGIIRVYMPQG
jgi:hypothetical protein